jgi:hypothetical protein
MPATETTKELVEIPDLLSPYRNWLNLIELGHKITLVLKYPDRTVSLLFYPEIVQRKDGKLMIAGHIWRPGDLQNRVVLTKEGFQHWTIDWV